MCIWHQQGSSLLGSGERRPKGNNTFYCIFKTELSIEAKLSIGRVLSQGTSSCRFSSLMRRMLWEQAGMTTLLAQMMVGRECPGNADGQALPQRVEISHIKNQGNPES